MVDQIGEPERIKNKKNIEKQEKNGLVDFNNFISDEVVEPGQKKLFNLAARNVKHEIINSYWWWKEKSNKYKKDIFVNIYNGLENKKNSARKSTC